MAGAGQVAQVKATDNAKRGSEFLLKARFPFLFTFDLPSACCRLLYEMMAGFSSGRGASAGASGATRRTRTRHFVFAGASAS